MGGTGLWEQTPLFPVSLKGLLNLCLNSPRKLESHPVGAENKPDTTVDVTRGRRTEHVERHRLTLCQSKTRARPSKHRARSDAANVRVNVDVFLCRRNENLGGSEGIHSDLPTTGLRALFRMCKQSQ